MFLGGIRHHMQEQLPVSAKNDPKCFIDVRCCVFPFWFRCAGGVVVFVAVCLCRLCEDHV